MSDATQNANMAIGLTSDLGNYLGSLLLYVSPWTLWYGVIGFVLALPPIIYLARKNLLRRKPRVWNILAKLSYVVILAAFSVGGALYGTLSHLQSRLHESLTTVVKPAIEARMPELRVYLADQVAVYGPNKIVTARDLVDPLMKQLYYVRTSDSLWERTKERCINGVLQRYGAAALTEALQQTLIGKIEAVGAAAKTDMHSQEQSELVKLASDVVVKLATDGARKIDFSKLDKTIPRIIIDALRKQIDHNFSAMYGTAAMLCVLLGSLIAGEMLLYFRWYLRRASAMPPVNAGATP